MTAESIRISNIVPRIPITLKLMVPIKNVVHNSDT